MKHQGIHLESKASVPNELKFPLYPNTGETLLASLKHQGMKLTTILDILEEKVIRLEVLHEWQEKKLIFLTVLNGILFAICLLLVSKVAWGV